MKTHEGRKSYSEYKLQKSKAISFALLTALDGVCTHFIVYEGDSVAKMYIGNWFDYETMMIEKFGKDLTPHRVKYRTLKR